MLRAGRYLLQRNLSRIAHHADGVLWRGGFELHAALNGGSVFHFNEVVSRQLLRCDQVEIDHYCGKAGHRRGSRSLWSLLQVVLWRYVVRGSGSCTVAMLQMKKQDIATLQRAIVGEPQA